MPLTLAGMLSGGSQLRWVGLRPQRRADSGIQLAPLLRVLLPPVPGIPPGHAPQLDWEAA
jgi:hypothetical protein